MYWDAHVHLSGYDKSAATLEKLLASMDKNDIRKAIALAAIFPRKSGSITNKELLALVAEEKRILVFGTMNADGELRDRERIITEGVNELAELLETGQIVGIKLYPGYQYFYPHEKALHPVYELALKKNVPVMFHSGLVYRNSGKMIYTHPYWVDEVATEFPDLKIIISHIGDPSVNGAVAVTHKNPNVYLDISGLVSNTTKGRLREEKWRKENEKLERKKIAGVMAELMGTKKIIWGTDWPISSHETYIALVEYLTKKFRLSRKEKEQMTSGNIRRLIRR